MKGAGGDRVIGGAWAPKTTPRKQGKHADYPPVEFLGPLGAPSLLLDCLLSLVLADLDHALLALAPRLLWVDGLLEALLASLGAGGGAKHRDGRKCVAGVGGRGGLKGEAMLEGEERALP